MSTNNGEGRVYLNNAATSFPKPEEVVDAVSESLLNEALEPGRNGSTGDILTECRETLAAFFDVPSPLHISLQPSATHALNMVITGLLWNGGHAIATVTSHNSMIRPLNHMTHEHGASVDYLRVDSEGRIGIDDLKKQIRPNTTLIALTHASNVTGDVQPLDDIATMAAEAEIPLLVDIAQSAGAIPFSYRSLPGRVFVAFAGHKGLLGPMGTGGLVLPDDNLRQTVYGGTGVRSEYPRHPEMLPLRHEAGTPNLPGIAGLNAGVKYLVKHGIARFAEHRTKLVHDIRDTLRRQHEVTLYPPAKTDSAIGIVSFRVRNINPDAVGFALEEVFGIRVRTGLHCAPLYHMHMGTAPEGTVRVSVGPFTTSEDIEKFAEAIKRICGK